MNSTTVPYAPIHLHSYFSLYRGCVSPEELCSYARKQRLTALGLTDTNNFYGLVRFLNAAEAAGLKPLAGAVLDAGGREICTAYVLTRRGFWRLAELISGLGKTDPAEDLLRRGWDGLALLTRDPELLERLRERGGADIYAKLVYGQSFRPLALRARRLGIPLCAVNDAWYIEPEDRGLSDLLQAMGKNMLLEDLPADRRLGPGNRAVSGAEMGRFFSAVPEALQNAWTLCERADGREILSRGRGEGAVFPRFRGQSEADSFRMLKALCLEGAARRYPPPPGRAPGVSPEVLRRLAYELGIIREKRFAGYFLVVRDIVSRCPRTCGRGSSASSIVSYLLGITHVDPLRYNLFFERFLNRDRVDPPDIDVDFPWDERETALRYVFERYRGRAGMVAEHVTFGPRSCLREPAKALGFAEEEIGRLVRALRRHDTARLPPALLLAARKIRGFPRHLGTHCGGVVITPEPITHYTHVQDSPLGYPVIAWEKDAAEDAGLVKIDLLGNRSLGVLRDTLALVNSRHRRRRQLSWEGFNPLGSRATRELIASGNTLGIFYIESPATRQLLKKMRRGDYENLVIASSIIRPAANRYIREFVRRLHGGGYAPLHPLLEETLRETRGIMVYQEDVSRVAIDVAGFSPGEADRLRKLLTRRPHSLAGADFRARFFQRGRRRGVDEAVLEKIWDMMLSFAGYSFCKAHSASYALVSYRLAWLKRFYPLEFLASVINNGGGYYTRQTYLNECRRLGFRLLPPDVNRSALAYGVEAEGLRVGLGQIGTLSAGLLERIIGERERNGPYREAVDFFQRVSPGHPEARILIRSGSLDSLEPGLTRPQLFWIYFRLGTSGRMLVHPPLPAEVGDYPPALKLLDEIRTLGVVISCHPLALFRRRILRRAQSLGFPPLISSAEIPVRCGRRVSLAGLLVTGKEVLTRKKEKMIFVSFEDEHSVYETVFFPAACQKYLHLLGAESAASRGCSGLFLVCGPVAEDQGALSVTVEGVARFDWQEELEQSLSERRSLPA
jgi:DNA polymerase III alpha subunit